MGFDGDDAAIDMLEIMFRGITLCSSGGHARVSGKRSNRFKLSYWN